MKLKVMTFNTQHCLNFVTRQIDTPVMAEAIKTCAPDIVALNEMRGKGAADGYDAQVDILAKMTVSSGKYKSTINGILADDFPELPTIDEKEAVAFKIPADIFN